MMKKKKKEKKKRKYDEDAHLACDEGGSAACTRGVECSEFVTKGTGLPKTRSRRSMSDRELFDLADSEAWPALIGELGKVDVGGGKNKMLYVDYDRYGGGRCCVFMMAAASNGTYGRK